MQFHCKQYTNIYIQIQFQIYYVYRQIQLFYQLLFGRQQMSNKMHPQSYTSQSLGLTSSLSATPLNRSFQQSQPVLYAPKKLQHLNCIEEPSMTATGAGLGGVYLGDIITLIKPQLIHANRIQAVLSCLAQSQTNYPINLPSNPVRKIIPANDTLNYPINVHFEESYQFIQSMRIIGKNVLVHCHAGVSRSAAIVCAYFMRKNYWGLQQTLAFLRTKRERVKPNQNFMRLLKEYEKNFVKGSQGFMEQSTSKKNIRVSENYEKMEQSRANNTKFSFRNSFQDNMQGQRKFLSLTQNQSPLKCPVQNSRKITLQKQGQSETRFQLQVQKQKKRILKVQNQNIKKQQNQNSRNCDVSIKLQQTQNHRKQRSLDKVNFENCLNRQKAEEKPSFGSIFKNKISMLLGRKTRIPWELSDGGKTDRSQTNKNQRKNEKQKVSQRNEVSQDWIDTQIRINYCI